MFGDYWMLDQIAKARLAENLRKANNNRPQSSAKQANAIAAFMLLKLKSII